VAESLGKAVLDLEVDDTKLVKGLAGAEKKAGSAATGMSGAFGRASSSVEQDVQNAGSDAERSLGGVNAAAEREAKRMANAFRDASSDLAGDVEDGAGDAEGSLEDIGSAAKRVGAVIGGALAVDSLVSTFDDSARAASRLEARLGHTAEGVEGYDKVARNVYRNGFGESMTDAADAVSEVHQALGVTGSALSTTTEDVLSLSGAFEDQGADAQIITSDLRSMGQAFPGTSKRKLIDQITHAFQQGAGTAGDLQDTLEEYPTAFKQLGLSSKDMTNWLTTGMKDGARNTDVLGDAVKEFGIRVKTAGDTGQKALHKMFPPDEAKRLIGDFAKGGKAGRDAFFEVLEQLNQVDDKQKKYNLSLELFGTKAEDLGGVLPKLVSGFTKMKDAQDKSAGAADSLGSQYTGISGTFEHFKRLLQTSIVSGLGEAAGAVVGFGSQAGVALMGFSALLGEGGLVGAFGKAKGAVMAFGKVLMANPYLLLIAATIAIVALIVTHWDQVKDYLSKTWDAIKGGLQTAWNAIKGFFERYWPILLGVMTGGVGLIVVAVVKHWTDIRDRAKAIFEGLKTIAKNIWKGIREVITAPIKGARSIIETVAGGIRTRLKAIFDGIKTTASNVWQGIRDVIEAPIKGARDVAQAAVRGVRDTFANVWETIKTAAGNAWGVVRDHIVKPIEKAKERVFEIIGNVATWLGKKWESITGAVGEFGEGVKKALEDAFKGAAKGVVGFIKAIIRAINLIPGVPNISTSGLDKFAEGGVVGAGEGRLGLPAFATGGGFMVPGHGTGDSVPVTVGGVPVAMVEPGELISVLNRDATSALMAWNTAFPRRGKGKAAPDTGGAGGGLPGFGLGGLIGGLAKGAWDTVAGLISDPLGALPSPSDFLPDWLIGTGKYVISHVADWVKDKVLSLLPFGGSDPSDFSKDAIKKFALMVGKADEINSWHTPYVWGGGHGSFYDRRGYDCSGAVSAVLGAAGLLSSPQTTDGLKTFGSGGDGGLVTVGVRGSTGRNAHTMMLLGSKGFESGGSNGGAGWTGGWDGNFPIHRHPAGLNLGGILGDLSEIFAPQRVGWGLSTGGTIPFIGSYETGGILPETGHYLGHKGEEVRPASRAGRIAGKLTITNWREGTGYFEEVADERADARDRDAHGNYLMGARP
jgi:phage-related minor tail protein